MPTDDAHLRGTVSPPEAAVRSRSRAVWTLLLVLLYASTPHVGTLAPRGILDAFSGALIVLSLCHAAFFLPRFPAVTMASAAVLSFVAYNLANGLYHEQQQTYLSVHTLYLAGETLSFLTALETDRLVVVAIVAVACAALAAVLVMRAWPAGRRPSPVRALVVGIGGILSLVAHAAITDESQFRLEQSAPFGHMVRSVGYVPFVRPDGELTAKIERDGLMRLLRHNPGLALPQRYSATNLQRLRGYGADGAGSIAESSSSAHAPSPHLGAALPSGRSYNVIVLVLESVRASEMGIHGSTPSATPFLDSLAESNLWARRFYATTNFTVKSEHAIHCSTLDFMIGPPISKRDLPVKGRCLPDLLREEGYRTFWFHGNDKAFYGRDRYLPRIGFDEILSQDELDPDGIQPVLGWGLPDPALLDMALDRLEGEKAPFYAEILTVSNHMPFDFDWGIDFPDHMAPNDTMYERYRRGIYFTDAAVERFYDRFLASELARDTLLVVTGDHGIRSFADEEASALVKNETFFRVPLIIRTPDGRSGTLEGNSSHLDVAPTIAHLLGTGRGDFLGRSLLDPRTATAPRVTYLMTEQALSYRLPGRACLPSVQCESNLNCYRRHGDEPPEPSCYAFEPGQDLLRDASATPIEATAQEMANDRALFDYSQMTLELGPLYLTSSGGEEVGRSSGRPRTGDRSW